MKGTYTYFLVMCFFIGIIVMSVVVNIEGMKSAPAGYINLELPKSNLTAACILLVIAASIVIIICGYLGEEEYRRKM